MPHMPVFAIIPARFASSRFPGKPLARETGKFLIQHVVERVRAARGIDQVLVATDDARIADAVASFGAAAVMTDPAHVTGSDRIAEVARTLGGAPDDILLNVQGDEPEIEPDCLSRLVERMRSDPAVPSGTLACPFPPEADPSDPNRVKVVVDRRGRALYFSRALIPFPRDRESGRGGHPDERPESENAPHPSPDRKGGVCFGPGRATSGEAHLLHLGVYAYRRAFLLEFAAWPPTRLEQIEKLEQLRIIEHGHAMLVEVVARATAGVDTPQDYAAFVKRWRAANAPRP